MTMAEETEAALLARWQDGDEEALDRLLRMLMPWLTQAVRPLVGPRLRAAWDLEDLLQEAVERFLVYLPRARVQDLDHFRRLFLRVTANLLRDRVDWLEARQKRFRPGRLPSDSTLVLAPGDSRSERTPSRLLIAQETREHVEFGLLLLPALDRALIVERIHEGRPWEEIGRNHGLEADAARHRFARAIAALGRLVQQMEAGELPVELPEDGEPGI